ncbi:MAG: SMEK domain-containing protein [Planctomycetaceae bacterium]
MVFIRTEALTAIADGLGTIKSSCVQRGLLHLFDNHMVAQHFFCRLLNAAYDLKLVELDNLEDNFPAIDLGDTERRIAYQVTTQRVSEKVTKTLAKFTRHNLFDQFDSLKILIIGDRQKTYEAVEIPDQVKFSTTDDILDLTDLLKYIGTLDTPHLQLIQKILSEEMTSPLRFSAEAPTLGVHSSNAAAQNSHAVAREYTHWVSRITSKYDVPGLGVSMPISDAWIELRLLDDEKDRRESKAAFETALRNYQEWFRLGDDTRLERFSAESAYLKAKRCVVIGGPGSGKTTLCRRIANQLSSHGELVIRVRLRRIQQLMENGSSFSEAVEIESTDGAGPSIDQRRELVHSSTMLIADGLDECDPQRGEIAKKILEWSDGHPNARVLVSTRPVGHHPHLLPEFRSFELLPLDRNAVTEQSRRLFDAALGAGETSTQKWIEFCREFSEEDRSAKSLASRNPLLLGFLVRLSIDGLEISSDRSDLYGQILQLMAVNPSSNPRNDVESDAAQDVVNVIGFELIQNPLQTIAQLVAAVSKRSGMARTEDVRTGLRFWESCRAIERLSAGHLSAVVFVHPSLGEFAAARYISTFDDDSLEKWLEANARKPMWRQVVLLACQISPGVVPQLVRLSDVNDPCSIEANIAAEAIAESPRLKADTELVSTALCDRFTSHIPLVSIEAALALQPVVRYLLPDSLQLDCRLLGHHFEWTRLSALSLLIHNKTDTVLRYFEEWFQTFTYSHGFFFSCNRVLDKAVLPEEAGELQHAIIKAGLPQLLESRQRSEIEDYFRNGRDLAKSVSHGMLMTIRSALAAAGFSQLSEDLNRDYDFSDLDFDRTNYNKTLVDALLCVCEFENVEATNCEDAALVWIQSIVGAIAMGKMPCRDGYYLKRRIGFEQFVEVLKGVVAAIGPNFQELRSELSVAMGKIAKGEMLSIYADCTAEPIWKRATLAGLNTDLLEAALEHPHPSVRYGAACLLDGGVAGIQLPQIVQRVLSRGSHHAVYLASAMLRTAYPDEFLDRAIGGLRTELRPGFEYLAEIVIQNADENLLASLKEDVARWLVYPEPYFVAHVVAELKKRVRSDEDSLARAVSFALDFWIARGSWCRDHQKPTHDISCPECNVCLPSPTAELLGMMDEMKLLTCEELFPFQRGKHSGIQKAANTAVLNILRRNHEYITSVLKAIDSEDLPVGFLRDVSSLPAACLQPNKSDFEYLLKSDKSSLRRWALNCLTGAWMPLGEAIAWAESFFSDSDPSMLTAATRILRQLTNGER